MKMYIKMFHCSPLHHVLFRCLCNTHVISAFLPSDWIFQHVLEDDSVLKELVPEMYEKVVGSTFVVLQLQMRTWDTARVTQESVFTSLSWGPVLAAPRKDCPIFPCWLLPVFSWARVPSRSVGHKYLLVLLPVIRGVLWLHWITDPQRETRVPGPWKSTTLMASHPHTSPCSWDLWSGALCALLSASHPTSPLPVVSAPTQPKLISPVAGPWMIITVRAVKTLSCPG